ncbi:ATPase [Thalassorhabdus alkalitolerans]|uniref:ATPase n=1 Tax=Thalassorhabdus alkalitolerans TaxID=2282697 RepID=A0ABW0YM79_9BACI
MRDVAYYPLSEDKELVIAADCSGGVGEKASDEVEASYELVGKYSARVAVMEALSVGASLTGISLHNFCGQEEWPRLVKGVQEVLTETGYPHLPLTGSTESNMNMVQSAFGVTAIGTVSPEAKKTEKTPENAGFAVVGTPLWGDSVLAKKDKVLPLSLFRSLVDHPGVYEIVPVGSKGIKFELDTLCQMNSLKPLSVSDSPFDQFSSAGPATCVIISFDMKIKEELKQMSSPYITFFSRQ